MGLKRQLSTVTTRFPDWKTNTNTWEDIRAPLAVNAGINRYLSRDTTSNFGSLSGTGKWIGGVLAPNGCIYGIPLNSTSILKIDPLNDSVSTFGNLSGTGKWYGGVLAPNGCIYGIPFESTSILKIGTNIPFVDPNFPLSRYFNKL